MIDLSPILEELVGIHAALDHIAWLLFLLLPVATYAALKARSG